MLDNFYSALDSFNSQPHTRLTINMIRLRRRRLIFQFTASYEADLIVINDTKKSTIFQFTASYEADRIGRIAGTRTGTFQFTASYEADRFLLMLFLFTRSFNSQPHTRLTV